MMRNRPWKLFNGGASAGGLLPSAKTASKSGVGPAEISSSPRVESTSVSSVRAAGGEFVGFVEPVMIVDLEGCLIGANEAAQALARRLGAPIHDGMRIEPLLAKAHVANAGGSPEWIPSTGALDAFLTAAEPVPGRKVFELRSMLRHDADGQPADWVLHLLDITPLVIALHGQRSAAAQRDRLLKLMSHDMRTPLAGILATLKHPDLATTPSHLKDVIETAAYRALSMIDSNVRLIRAQCSDYRFVELDFCHVVEEAIDASWSLAKAAGIRIVLEPTAFSSQISADRGYLTEALNELFVTFVRRGVPSGMLSCSLSQVTWEGRPAVRLDIRDPRADRSTVTESEDSCGSIASTPHAHGVLDDGGPLDFFRTVVTRLRGAVIFDNETDVGQGISVTIPSVGAADQPS